MAPRKGRLRPADDLIAPAVAETIGNLTISPEDAGAVKLAERYAAAIDEATHLSAAASELLDAAAGDDQLLKRVAKLAAQVEAKTVLRELGPQLQSVLESLGATPRARVQMRGGASHPPQHATSRLAQIRAARK